MTKEFGNFLKCLSVILDSYVKIFYLGLYSIFIGVLHFLFDDQVFKFFVCFEDLSSVQCGVDEYLFPYYRLPFLYC